MSSDRYKFLYEISRKSLDEEIDRYKRLDEKAGRLSTIAGIGIVAYSALIKEAVSAIKGSPLNLTCVSLILASALTYLVLWIALGRLLGAVKPIPGPRITIGEVTTAMIENGSMETAYFRMAEECQKATELARENLKKNQKALI